MLVLNQRYKVSVIEAAAYAWGDVGWVVLAEHAPEVLAVQVVDDLVAEVLGDFVGHLTGDAAGDVAFDLSQVVGDALELAGDAGVELLLPFDEGHDVAGELGEAFGQLDELIGEDEAADAGKKSRVVSERLEEAEFFLFVQGHGGSLRAALIVPLAWRALVRMIHARLRRRRDGACRWSKPRDGRGGVRGVRKLGDRKGWQGCAWTAT